MHEDICRDCGHAAATYRGIYVECDYWTKKMQVRVIDICGNKSEYLVPFKLGCSCWCPQFTRRKE